MSEQWRCFVAVPLGDDLRAALADALAAWRTQPPADRLRWTDPENLHLTLAFLGDVDPQRIASIKSSIERAVADHEPIVLETGRLGAFFRSSSARVLWYGVADPAGRCAALADDIADALGLASDEPFRPHITLARARHHAEKLRGWIEAASAAAPQGSLVVDRVDLMRSHLGQGPARYEVLASIPLRVSSHV